MSKILNNIIKQTILEYSSMKKLPFEEDEFKNKNYIEQYTDWLEDFGKYGTLPPSTLDFWDEIKKAIQIIIDEGLRNHAGLGLDDDVNTNLLKLQKIIEDNLKITKDNKIYVERAVQINENSTDYDKSDENGNDPQTLYNQLVQNYNHNVGGCWCYKQDSAESYCSVNEGDIILFKGYIRTDDIDFVKTVLLNFHYDTEHEIRVKPNAKVELFEVLFNCKYKAPLKGNLIVSATYFGNNGIYKNGYAPVDDGFGNFKYMDRTGNIHDTTTLINNRLSNNEDINDIFDFCFKLTNNLYKVMLNKKYNILDINKRILLSDIWFKQIYSFRDNLARVERKDGKMSLIDKNGKLIGNGELWFNYIGNFENGLADVTKDGKYSLLKTNGELIGNGNLWFNFIGFFNDGLAKVERDDDKCSFIDTNGKLIGDGKLWFDNAMKFVDGFAKVEYNDNWYYIDTKGNFYDIKTKKPISSPIQENKIMKRQVIKLTESDLHKIIKNSIKQLINLY